jgi:hypothetical protein
MTCLHHALIRASRRTLLPLLFISAAFAQPRAGSLRGQVTDELGGVIVGATMILTAADGVARTATTSGEGIYLFNNLSPGKYTIRVMAVGFNPYESSELAVAPGGRATHDIRLSVALEKQEITVTGGAALSTDPENNSDAIVLRDKDLDVLPDDPDALAAAVQALAGPSTGPSGGQIFIDGFSGGRMPPKESIREVRVNQNPFNAENDRPGFGRIDIITKPGTDRLRGSAFYSFEDESMNSRNPLSPTRAPFQVNYFGGTLSGTVIPKKASFFFDFTRRGIDDNALINATVLDASLNPARLTLPVVQPLRFTSLSPRFDYQVNDKYTLGARYSYTRSRSDNAGIGGFSLLERAFDTSSVEQTAQLTGTVIVNPNMINEARFQYVRWRAAQNGDNSIPTIQVLEAFTSGGSQIGLARSDEDRWELQNYSTLTHGQHVMRFGVRLRGVRLVDVSPQNFGGTFTFAGGLGPELDANNQVVLDGAGNPVLIPLTSLERYRRTLLFEGLPATQIRALGGGPTQFSIASGNPAASVSQVDFGGFFQDEWRLRPNLTLTAGLRYETQNNINSKFNFAPRLFFAWAPGGGSTASAPGAPAAKMVIRGGIGVFYHRFSARGTLLAERFNGINQQDYRVFDPEILDLARFTAAGVTNVPTAEMLGAFAAPQITRRIADNFQAPYSIMTAVTVERQLPGNFTLFVLFFNFRSRHLLRIRNINAPLPGTYDPQLGAGVRPDGSAGDIYYYESSGKFNDYRFFIGLRRQLSKGFSLFANYGTGKARSDTDCIFGSLQNCFPADSYDLSSEYGRVFQRHFFLVGGSIALPLLKLNLNPFIIGSTGQPFNITTGRDTNGDGLFTERPAFATSATDPLDLRRTRFGDFDLNPAPGQPLIPRNYGTGPKFFSVNLGVSRTFGFGEAPKAAAVTASQDGPASSKPAAASGPQKSGGNDAAKKSDASSSAQKSGGPGSAPAPEKRFSVTLSVQVDNLLNRTNLDVPVGNLSSPRFGESLSIRNGFNFGPGGSAAAGNRRVRAQIRFNF